MWKDAYWIGVPDAEIRQKNIYQGDMNGHFALFRLTFDLSRPGSLTLDISAYSRYRLWVNGEPVCSGPCRSGAFRYYFETVDVGAHLRAGKNVLAVQVLLCDSAYTTDWNTDPRMPLFSVEQIFSGHRLAVEGLVLDETGTPLADVTTGKADWRVWVDNTWHLTREPGINDNMGAITEHIDFTRTPAGWKTPGFDTQNWLSGQTLEPVASGPEALVGILKPFVMEPRPIPLLREEPGMLTKELGQPVMGEGESITVPPHQTVTLLFDGETMINGYFRYRMEQGAEAELRFTCFEKFSGTEVRDDSLHGKIGTAQTDTVRPSGDEMIYEPFWYRTMRFLRIEITTGKEPLVFFRPEYRETGYPLNPRSWVRSSEPWVERVYEMCVRTLQCCMTDAYMDCPYWEQMQYPMDTRLQAMFTYVCSTDTRLAKKALADFHDSILPMGLVQGHAPAGTKQIISTFSLHYIFMLLEYYHRTGDQRILREYRADVDRILEYYDRHIGNSGLVEDLGYWDFVDWQETWGEVSGRPNATRTGPSTIINLMYGKALLDAAEICEITGRSGLAQEYRQRQNAIAERVQALCWDDERQMYREGQACMEFTQHAQSWAVLNGMVTGSTAVALMEKTFTEPDVLRCYFSTCYELFRACEMAGCYHLTAQQMEWWKHLLDLHCVTCPETPSNSRSECHGWSALPMYELLSVVAGIRRTPGKPGQIEISPRLDYLPDLEGGYITEYGMIEFLYARNEDQWNYEIQMPEGLSGVFVGQNGTRQTLLPGRNRIQACGDRI